ncbi:MAG: MBL fold metallo-hydrolase [Chloroflexi bacterium]|nr:MBL fold metallo-hydrolase [Chloroflexota bacterium]
MAIKRVNVGSVEIVSVTDGAMRGTPAYFFAGVTPDVYTPALGNDLREDGTFAIEFGSFLVRSSGRTILVDTGLGNKLPGGTGGMLLENLKQIGVGPGDIDVVVNTHLHVDHVGWNCTESGGGYVPTFPNAEYWISEQEWQYSALFKNPSVTFSYLIPTRSYPFRCSNSLSGGRSPRLPVYSAV